MARRRKTRFSLRMCRICSQTQLDGIAHEQTIICRQLFAGHVVGSRPVKRKKGLLRMIITIIIRSKFLNSVITKYRDLSMSRISQINYLSKLRLRQIIDLLATDKSRYFAQPRPIIVNYSFKIFPRFWLAKSTRTIHQNQLLMTKFGRILCLTRKWRQKCSVLSG